MSRTALGVAGTAVAAIATLWLLPLPVIAQATGSLVLGVAALALPTAWRSPVGTLRASPEAALAHVAGRLRLARLRVAEEPQGLVVRTGALVLLRIDAAASVEGCAVRYRVDLDPVGGMGYLLLMGAMVLLVTGVPALALALRLHRLEARDLLPAVPPDGAVPAVPPRDAVRTALVEGLSEAHRLAAEAREAARSAYGDRMGIALLTGVLAGAGVLLVGVLASPPVDPVPRLASVLPFAAAGAAVAGIPPALYVRRRDRPGLVRYREWEGRLRELLEREVARLPAEDGGRSSFEVLLEASREAPGWIEARRRAGLSADLGLWSLAYLVLGYVLSLDAIGFQRIATDPLGALAAVGGSALLAAGLILWWRRWTRRQREAAARRLAAWTARFEGIRAGMERYLQDL